MSPEMAEAVRGLLNVCGDTNEVQPTQLANRGQSQGVSGAASAAPVLHANHRSQEGPSALSTKRQALQDQVTTMCCENRACKKVRLRQQKGDYTCLHFLLCVLSDQLYICSCAVYNGLLFRWCESTAAIARGREEYLVSHCTMERRKDGLPANRVRNRGQRGRNPPWYCNCPDCRRGFTRPHVFRSGQVNGLRNVRLRVLY